MSAEERVLWRSNLTKASLRKSSSSANAASPGLSAAVFVATTSTRVGRRRLALSVMFDAPELALVMRDRALQCFEEALGVVRPGHDARVRGKSRTPAYCWLKSSTNSNALCPTWNAFAYRPSRLTACCDAVSSGSALMSSQEGSKWRSNS